MAEINSAGSVISHEIMLFGMSSFNFNNSIPNDSLSTLNILLIFLACNTECFLCFSMHQYDPDGKSQGYNRTKLSARQIRILDNVKAYQALPEISHIKLIGILFEIVAAKIPTFHLTKKKRSRFQVHGVSFSSEAAHF